MRGCTKWGNGRPFRKVLRLARYPMVYISHYLQQPVHNNVKFQDAAALNTHHRNTMHKASTVAAVVYSFPRTSCAQQNPVG